MSHNYKFHYQDVAYFISFVPRIEWLDAHLIARLDERYRDLQVLTRNGITILPNSLRAK